MTDVEAAWYLRHRDGVEHGPFQFADIVAAAKLGNIADDTCVRHEVKTLGQWVFAPRVQPIADVMTKAIPRPGPARPTIVPAKVAAAKTPAQAAAITKHATASAASVTAPVSLNVGDSNAEAIPIVRPSREQGYPVPRTFVDACIALLDFRFRSFVTPWIVKILWGFCVAGMILWMRKLAYVSFLEAEVPETATVATASEVTVEWQFEPLAGQPFLESPFFRFLVSVGAMFCGLLCFRVMCEGAIVLFRAANDLHDLKQQSTR